MHIPWSAQWHCLAMLSPVASRAALHFFAASEERSLEQQLINIVNQAMTFFLFIFLFALFYVSQFDVNSQSKLNTLCHAITDQIMFMSKLIHIL